MPPPSWRTVKRVVVTLVGGLAALVLFVAATLGMSSGHPQASTATATDVPPAVLAAYQDAADGADIPWPVLAGIGWVQTDHGRTAPGETIQRDDPGDPPSSRTGAGGSGAAPTPSGADVWLTGDSLMVGVVATGRFAGATDRAHDGDPITAQIPNLAAAATAHAPLVLVSLGTNDAVNPAITDQQLTVRIDQALAATKGTECVVWDTVQAQFPPGSPYQATVGAVAPRFDRLLISEALRYPWVRIYDWAQVIAQHPSWTAPDGLHLTSAGYHALAAGFADTATSCPTPTPVRTGHLSPDLNPPITSPGWGLYLARSADTLRSPQNLDNSSEQIADLLADAVDTITQRQNVDEDDTLDVFDPDDDTRQVDPAVWNVWVEAIASLPLVSAADAATQGGLGAAAMTRAAYYAQFSPSSAVGAGRTGLVGATVPYAADFNAAGTRYGIDPRMLAAVARTESGFDPAVIACHRASTAGALGIMQIMPATARAWNIDPCNPDEAIPAAAAELQRLHEHFGTWPLAWAAYNAGAGAVERYGGVPPYPETQQYVRTIQAYWDQYIAEFPSTLPTVDGTPCAGRALDAVLAAAPSSAARTAIRAACTQLGVSYVWGGETPGIAMDCSGLTQWVWAQAGIHIDRTTWEQENDGTPVPTLAAALPGDLLILEGGAHIGLYLGNCLMIHAPHTGTVVQVARVYETPVAIRRPP
jgi:cell wall-associated NlpC family hydrolase/lysophospholipase L1-like esterase